MATKTFPAPRETKTFPPQRLGSIDPVFSQPLRQIAMMVGALALVSAGVWFVFSTILSIFESNPFLNGAILAVFGLGVLTCFWQVYQLMVSVNWIEGFAAERPGHEITKPPAMLAPLAALLRGRGKSQPISTSSARSILDSVAARIDEARDITRYLASLLIFLGLLGTFYGLATTVPAVVDTIRALAPKPGESSLDVFQKLMGGLEKQLGGMGTAFSSSLLGLAGSLVVGLLELFSGHGQARFYRELEDWMSGITRLSFAGAEGEGEAGNVAGVLDHMAEQMEALQAIYVQSDISRAQVDARLGTLADAVEKLAAASTNAAALQRLAEGQERLTAALTRVADEGAGGLDAESRMRLRSIDTQMLRLLEDVAAGRQESITDLRGDLAALTRAVKLAGREAVPLAREEG